MFQTPLEARFARDGFLIVREPLVWSELGMTITVPKGFLTDLASIPPVFQGVLKKNGNSARAAVLHDYLYQRQVLCRKDADRAFARALRAEGVRGWRLYYAGVRSGGRKAWRRYSKFITIPKEIPK